VYLAQARCLSSLGRLKDAIDIVRGCVMSFEQFGISNSLSRQFRVEFGSMLIDVGSFSEASEFFEKVCTPSAYVYQHHCCVVYRTFYHMRCFVSF
jgi:hypothetical protein